MDFLNTFKYQVSWIDEKVSVRINLFLLPIFPPSSHSIVVFSFPVGISSLTRHSQQVLLGVEVSSVSWLGQFTVGVQITDYFNCSWVSKCFCCCLAWAVDLGVQVTDEGRSLYIGSFCPAMTSLSRYLEETAFIISISSSMFICLCLFSMCIKDIVSSIVFISCPSCRICSENLDLPSAYLKSFLYSLNRVLKFLLVLPI
jgi:hypothetical protein